MLYYKQELHPGITIVRNHYDTIIWLILSKEFFSNLTVMYIFVEFICGVKIRQHIMLSIQTNFSYCKRTLIFFKKKV